MRSLSIFLLTSVGIMSLSGCQCFRATDHVMDCLDDVTDINDHRYKLDRYYCPQADVTRWCMHGPCVGNNHR